MQFKIGDLVTFRNNDGHSDWFEQYADGIVFQISSLSHWYGENHRCKIDLKYSNKEKIKYINDRNQKSEIYYLEIGNLIPFKSKNLSKIKLKDLV